MTLRCFRFDRFYLDTEDRSLSDGAGSVDLSSRYFDALVLLVTEQGRLVAKDRFMEEVWRGIPVTDEALTQCIRTLRRQLGDDASRPRFIETVPKHGYRFIAPVETRPAVDTPRRASFRQLLLLAGAGTLGGIGAGVVGGLLYGFAAASDAGSGAISALLVLVAVIVLVGLIGAAGVSFGIASATALTARPNLWTIVGGAAGGLGIGAAVKLLGLDAFTILVGRSPGNITGASEGLVLGTAVGLAVWAGAWGVRRTALIAAAAGAAGGVLIARTGGRLMGGSLALLADHFPGSRLRLDGISTLFGEKGFGPVTQAATAALEGALFAASVAGAIALASKALKAEP